MSKEVHLFSQFLTSGLATTLRTTDDLYMMACGKSPHFAGQMCENVHKFGFHLHFVLSGKGTLHLGEKCYHIRKSQIFVLPDDRVVTYYPDSEEPWYYVWLSLNGTKAAQLMEKVGLTEDTPVLDAHIPMKEFAAVIEEIVSLHEMTLCNEMLRESLLFRLISLLFKSKQLEAGSQLVRHDYSAETYVEHTLNYIHANYGLIKVAEIGKTLGISQSYMSHIFKDLMGVSLQKYLIQYRMEQAAKQLRETEDMIRTVSRRVGYEDQFTFSRTFKNIYGESPKKYRERHKKGRK